MKALLAYITCRISHFLLKFVNRGGSLPGDLALKIDKDILKKIHYPKQVILVTATNGKTSTTNLIANILKKAGKKVIYNHKGDNLIYGITSLLLTNCSFKLKVKADVAVIEVDEITLSNIAQDIKATHILINNFFRDQLDRSGEMENVVTRIEKALKNFEGTLILNQDDPSVIRIQDTALNARILSYHLEENEYCKKISTEASEGKFCPRCSKRLNYEYYQYSHIGKFSCECGFGQKKANFNAKIIDIKSGSFIWENTKFQSSNPSLYHIYNNLAALALCEDLNINHQISKEVITSFEMSLGRNEKMNLKDKTALLNLVKNPTGCNEIIKMINQNENKKTILFVLNDNPQDSRDVSWIWDVDFESLNNVSKMICSGKRAYEIALRIKYGELNCEIQVETEISSAVNQLALSDGELYVLATYTALPVVRKELKSWS